MPVLVVMLIVACVLLFSALITAQLVKMLKTDPRATYAGAYAWAALTVLLGVAEVVLAIVALNTIPSPHG